MFVQRLFANIWSFISTLFRSLLALFSFRHRASNTFSLPSVNRTPNDALARAHSHLRPILLTPRSITLADSQRAQGTHPCSAASALFRGYPDNQTASPSIPQTGGPQRTPKLGLHDTELGLSVVANDLRGHPAASATSFRECTPDTTRTGSLYVLPLTPPDRCYLAPLPSTTDCPYTESWPTGLPIDRSKSRFSGSPLKLSTNVNTAFPEPMVASIGSPPPGRWSPLQVWTSTPCKNDSPDVPDPALSPFEHDRDPSSALSAISRAIVSRSRGSIQPYDDTSNSSASSDASPFVDLADGPTHKRHHAQVRIPRSKNQPYPRFHHPDAYAFTWRHHGDRLPGKANRRYAYARSRSHIDLHASVWYDADAFAPSPVAALSPPRGESTTEGEDEDEIPLCRLRERLASRSAAVGPTISLGVPISGIMSPHTRRMSEGCLLAISESTPTRIGVGSRSSRQVLSMALDGEYDTKDWLEALSLRFSSENKDVLAG